MKSIDLFPDAASNFLFRAHRSVALRRHGQDGYRLLGPLQGTCPACGSDLPSLASQMVRSRPVLCKTCGRLLVGQNAPYLPRFAALFTEATKEVSV